MHGGIAALSLSTLENLKPKNFVCGLITTCYMHILYFSFVYLFIFEWEGVRLILAGHTYSGRSRKTTVGRVT